MEALFIHENFLSVTLTLHLRYPDFVLKSRHSGEPLTFNHVGWPIILKQCWRLYLILFTTLLLWTFSVAVTLQLRQKTQR